MKSAKKEMIKAIHNDFNGRFKKWADAGEMELEIAYSGDDTESLAFLEEVKAEFPGYTVARRDPLSLSVACHIGPGALALACCRKIDKDHMPN